MSETPKILGREMEKEDGEWKISFGPIQYRIDHTRFNGTKCITWLLQDPKEMAVGRSVPFVDSLEGCCKAIEDELRSIYLDLKDCLEVKPRARILTTSTRTVAIMEVSAQTANEVAHKLAEAGYDHSFIEEDGVVILDMNGIALRRLGE